MPARYAAYQKKYISEHYDKHLDAVKKYDNKNKITCKYCEKEITKKGWKYHETISKEHQKNLEKYKN